MDWSRLDILADKFWEGDCSEAEEQELKEAIRYGTIPERHHELKEYLEFLDSSQLNDSLDESFDQQMIQEIAQRERTGGSGFPWMKIAAGIAVLIGLFVSVRYYESQIAIPEIAEEVEIVDTYEDPEMAYEEVKKALMLVGMKMNDGMSYTGSIGAFDKATDEIQNNSNSDQSGDKKTRK